MQLQPIEPDAFAQRVELGGPAIGDHADEAHSASNGIRNLASSRGVNGSSRAFYEIDADRVGAELCRELGVFNRGDAAYFDPHVRDCLSTGRS